MNTPHQIIYSIVAIIIAMVVHEMMHGYAALALGDRTAQDEGRLSLNPLNHIDPFMTIILPIITYAIFQIPLLAAKPVPFNGDNLRNEEFGPALVAAAGPLSNLVMAIIASLLLHSVDPFSTFGNFLITFAQINVWLFIFNLIPIPPLDGSRILYVFAPEGLQRLMLEVEPWGLFIVFGLAIGGGLSFLSNLAQSVLNLLP